MLFAIIFGSVVGLVIILFFLSTYICYRLAFFNDMKDKPSWEPMGSHSHKRWQKEATDMIADARAIPFQEDLYIDSFDGCQLHAYLYISNPDSNVFAIECHGYKDPAVKDFCGGLPLALKKGQNVLLIEHRGHGKSGGRTIAFGIKERYDVLEWCKYLNSRFNNPKILLYGISMGAATVLLASSLDLPENVLGIVADCPYSSAKDEVLMVTEKMKVNPKIAYPFLLMGGLIYGHFDLRKGEVRDAVKHTKKPILLIHGTDDTTVPFSMAEELYRSNEEMITFIPFEGAPHGYSWMLDYDKYMSSLNNFYKKCGIE